MKKQRPMPIPGRSKAADACPCGSGRPLAGCCVTKALGRRMATAVIDHQHGRHDAAYAGYSAILAEHPQHADAHHYIGVIQFQRGALEDAAATLRHAIELRPDVAAYHANLGNVLKRLGHTDAALAAYSRSLELDPRQAVLHYNLGLLQAGLERSGAALTAFQQAVKYRPDWAEAWLQLGKALYAEEAIDAAAEAYRQALKLDPRLAGAHQSLGIPLLRFGDVDGAIQSFGRAEKLAPDNEPACTSRLFALGLSVSHSGEEILAAHQSWQQRFGDRVAPLALPPRPAGDRLRIAYLSGDLRRHAMRFFARAMLREHDRNRFAVTVYATHGPEQADDVTAELQALADTWVDCHALDNTALARRIADDGIDILVDLAGHTAGGRMLALAAHPAHFQCTMLGYMTTTGAKGIDARISDARAIPPEAEAWFSERILPMPHSQWCYAPDPAPPEVGGLPARQNGYITYGSFHNVAKINARVLSLWIRMLQAQPAARLLLVGWGEAAKGWLRRPFREAGLESRVEIIDPLPHERYLELYQRIDISLDVFPYAGGTVTCESLWMGVPSITMDYHSPAGRGGASILSAVGLTEWIVRDEDEWLARAAKLAADLPALEGLRADLRQRMLASPLMDHRGYVADLEKLLAAQV